MLETTIHTTSFDLLGVSSSGSTPRERGHLVSSATEIHAERTARCPQGRSWVWATAAVAGRPLATALETADAFTELSLWGSPSTRGLSGKTEVLPTLQWIAKGQSLYCSWAKSFSYNCFFSHKGFLSQWLKNTSRQQCFTTCHEKLSCNSAKKLFKNNFYRIGLNDYFNNLTWKAQSYVCIMLIALSSSCP